MAYRLLADVVLVLHLGFVLFVVVGGLLVLRWPRLIWLHVPAVVWGVLIEFTGWPCPLTPIEKHLRRLGGEAGYATGFIEHYLVSILYPSGLSRETQALLGTAVLVINVVIYFYVARSYRQAGSS